MLQDPFERKITYLRLSLTDRCNLRCHYCMPEQRSAGIPSARFLSFAELRRLVAILVDLGIRKVRITGGEPLVRHGVPDLIESLLELKGLEEILMTTNGTLLKDYAPSLRAAGLKRINVHLDSLKSDRFAQITRGGHLASVLDGLAEAQAVGLSPIKINTVVQQGINDGEILDLVRFSAERGFILRLIELMPIGEGLTLQGKFISTAEVKRLISEHYTLLPYGTRLGSGPAEYYKVVELNSVIGFIHPVSQPFCQDCNRIRISADGQFQDCLAFRGSTTLREMLRNPKIDDENLAAAIRNMIGGKRPDHNDFQPERCNPNPSMYGIGG